jgi:hypothetical protein
LAQEAGGDESKFAAALRRSGKFAQANEIEKARNERLKGETETLDKRLGIYKSAADQLQDRNQALGWLQSQFNDPLVGPLIQSRGRFEDLAANIPDSASDPEGFDRWRMASSQGLSKVKEQFAPKPVTVNLGGRQVVIDQNPSSPTFGKELQSFVSSNPATDMLVFDPKTGRYVTNEPLVSAKARVAQAGASVTLGSPVPVTLADGSTVLVQPGNRPGAQPQVVTVGGKPVAPPPTKQGDATEAERNAAGYLLRMEEATKLLDQFEKKGRASYGTQIAGAVPLVGEAARRVTMTPEQAQYRQAQEDWVRAKLRKESGASIASDEMEREIATYFPMPGEGPEVVEQKRQARLVANDSFRASAGRAAAKPKAAQPAGPFSDAEKERRYQEWKKTQTGAQ